MSFGATYLKYPDLFPARPGGERCGERRVVIELPGGPYGFSGLDSAQEKIIRERLEGHCWEPPGHPAPAVDTVVFRVAGAEFVAVPTRGWEYALDLDYQPAAVRLAGLELMGRIDWSPQLRGALWTSAPDPEVFYGAFENFFRVLFAYRLLECGGALLHSAGVVDGAGAAVFVGRSGAGKSTLARLSAESGRTVLSDDLNALWPPDEGVEGVVVARLPLTGDFRAATSGAAYHPLRAICRLEKGGRNSLAPLSPAEALGALLASSPSVNRDPYRREQLIANLTELLQSVPTYVLTFSREGGFWELLP